LPGGRSVWSSWAPEAAVLDSPGITVVIPVWDQYVKVVGHAVESVLRQSGVTPVVLVVDNASTQPLPTFPPVVRVERLRSRVSVGAARNAGLALVRTEFMLFMDADDIMVDGTLTLLLSQLRATAHASACCCALVAWNPCTGRIVPLRFPSRRTMVLARWPTLYRTYAVLANRMPTTGCVLMRTALAREAGGFGDGDYAEDWPLNVALAFRGSIEFLPFQGRLLRVHSGSLRSRPWGRDDVARGFAMLRGRLRSDPTTPWLVRLGLPIIAVHHWWQVRRLTRGGTIESGLAVRIVGRVRPLSAALGRPARRSSDEGHDILHPIRPPSPLVDVASWVLSEERPLVAQPLLHRP
jgi:glycosyl transferase family 2